MSDLLSVDQALQTILTGIRRVSSESIHLTDARGRVVATDLRATLNIPPFPNSSMDGFAVIAADVWASSTLPIVMDIPAGAVPDRPLPPGKAARIMTGAPIPPGADAVVPVENTDVQFTAGSGLPERITITAPVYPGDNVRPAGEDLREGDLILPALTLLRPQEIGVLAALGQAEVQVLRRPRVAILSSGDELLNVDQPLTAGKIHDVNGYTLAGLVEEHGGIPLRFPIARDTVDSIRGLFLDALAAQPDMVISSAGVSVGSYDLVRSILAELGRIEFWKINLRPGKPLAFGELYPQDAPPVPFFGLPGNPVSAMVTFDVLVRPALRLMGGLADDAVLVRTVTGHAFTSDGRRSFLRVRLTRDDAGRWIAASTGTQSSGALTSMVTADALLIIPEGVRTVEPGTELSARLLRRI